MAGTLIEVTVYRSDNNKSFEGAVVTVSGTSIEVKTGDDGVALVKYPWDSGTVSIYVNGETAFSGYVSDAAKGVTAKRTWRNW